MIELEAKYGKDVVDLVKKIETFLERSLKHRSFDGVYAECTTFSMTPINNVGVFMVKFPNCEPVALAGINMVSGEYIFTSTNFGKNTLNIFELKDFQIDRLIDRAETEWSFEAKSEREAQDQTDFSYQV